MPCIHNTQSAFMKIRIIYALDKKNTLFFFFFFENAILHSRSLYNCKALKFCLQETQRIALFDLNSATACTCINFKQWLFFIMSLLQTSPGIEVL